MGVLENIKDQIDLPEEFNTSEKALTFLRENGVSEPVIELLKIDQPEQRTPEWFEARKGKLTGSIIDSILGRSKYQSRTDTLMKKLGIGKKFTGNTATKHGEKYEDEAIDLFCKKMGMSNLNFGLLPHPEIEYLAGSPDGITYCGKVLEVKCPLYRKIKIGEVPEHYLAQIYINMEIAGLDEGYFIEYAPTSVTKSDDYILNIVNVKKDPNWFKEIKPELDKFYDEYKLYKQIGVENHPEYEKYVIKEPECDIFPERHEERFPYIKEEVSDIDEDDTVNEYSQNSFIVPDTDDEEEEEESKDFGQALLDLLVKMANGETDDTETSGEESQKREYFQGLFDGLEDYKSEEDSDYVYESDSCSDSETDNTEPSQKRRKTE